MTMTPTLEAWLDARGIDVEVAARFGVSSIQRGGTEWAVIPYYEGGVVVNRKYRCLSEKKHAQDKNGRKIFWNVDVLADHTLDEQPLIITEGEWDAMVAIQCGYHRTVSVPDGAPSAPQGQYDTGTKYTYLMEVVGKLREFKDIVLAVDGDDPGNALLSDMAVRIGRVRCRSVKYPPGCKDLNDVYLKYGPRGVTEAIQFAGVMGVPRSFRMSEIADEPEPIPYKLDFPGFEHLWKLRLGDFVVVTGAPGGGKTTFVNDICCRMAEKYEWRITFASFEQHPRHDHRRNLRTWHGQAFMKELRDDELAAADAWIEQYFRFVVPHDEDDVTLLWILEKLEHDVLHHGTKIVVIDPWNELDHDYPDGMSETEYIGFAIRAIRRFARRLRVLPIVVAHPAKMRRNRDGEFPMPGLWDISGSSNWANKADIGIIVHREDQEARICMAKVRYCGVHGEYGEVRAHLVRNTGRFHVEDV